MAESHIIKYLIDIIHNEQDIILTEHDFPEIKNIYLDDLTDLQKKELCVQYLFEH